MQLLVDFIVVKLHKQESSQTWRELGYDIAGFTVPQASQMKSNFLKSAVVQTEPSENSTAAADSSEDNKAEAEDKSPEKTE